MVKLDGVTGNYSKEIKRMIATVGFDIAVENAVHLDEAAVRIFCRAFSKRILPHLVKYMTSGPVMEIVIERENAVAHLCGLVGPIDAK